MKNHLTIACLLFIITLFPLSCSDTSEIASSLEILADEIVVQVSETVSLEAVLDPESLRPENLYWHSENPGVATVSFNGEVTGISEGSTVIHVEGYGRSASCRVDVSVGGVTMISFGESYFNVKKGDSFRLPLKLSPDDIPLSNVVWACSDETVISLSDSGEITALEEGYTTVTATCGGMSAECVVYVYGDPEIGDYFYSDGSWSGKPVPGKQIVGVVFWTGDPTVDDVTLKNRFPECTNGLVVSINSYRSIWQDNYVDYGGLVDTWRREHNKMKYMMDISYFYCEGEESKIISGFNNTVVLKAFNEELDHYFYRIGIVRSIDEQERNYPLPESVSGWYVPSIKELSLLCSGDVDNVWEMAEPRTEVKEKVNASLKEIVNAVEIGPEIYWSSNEMYEDTSIIIDMLGGHVNQCTKNVELYVRYVFAF